VPAAGRLGRLLPLLSARPADDGGLGRPDVPATGPGFGMGARQSRVGRAAPASGKRAPVLEPRPPDVNDSAPPKECTADGRSRPDGLCHDPGVLTSGERKGWPRAGAVGDRNGDTFADTEGARRRESDTPEAPDLGGVAARRA